MTAILSQAEHYDFIIIGAGTAGCVLAARLSHNPSHRVCLVEAGGSEQHPFIRIPAAVGAAPQGALCFCRRCCHPAAPRFAQLDGTQVKLLHRGACMGSGSGSACWVLVGWVVDRGDWFWLVSWDVGVVAVEMKSSLRC
jgi:choline dehydrogenase-like flavoprotein